MLEANRWYEMEVTGAFGERVGEKKTPVLKIAFACEEGKASHNIWLTAKARDIAEETIGILGWRGDVLSDRDWWEDVANNLKGKVAWCFIEQNGQYLNIGQINDHPAPRGASSDPTVFDVAASLFGKNGVEDGSDINF